jgi:hypothetical protein
MAAQTCGILLQPYLSGVYAALTCCEQPT